MTYYDRQNCISLFGYSLLSYRSIFLIGGIYVIKFICLEFTDKKKNPLKICCLHNVNEKTSNTYKVLFWFRLAKMKFARLFFHFIFAFYTDHIFLHCLYYLLMCRLLLICTKAKKAHLYECLSVFYRYFEFECN